MTAEVLSSNVMNYLVWRYLQESGYARAADRLARSWIQKPDTLPFAHNVQSHLLINLVQDGLYLDSLQSEVQKSDKRYHFGPDHGPPFPVLYKDALECEPREGRAENGVRRARQDTGQEGENGVIGGLDLPAQKSGKRKRRSNGTEGKRVNGEAIPEVETNGVLHPIHTESAPSEVESPVVEEIIPPSTLETGLSKSVQSDRIVDLSDSSQMLDIDRPAGAIIHSIWSPDIASLLITAGQDLVRLHSITSAGGEFLHNDLDLQRNSNYEITAACWTTEGEAAVATLESEHGDEGVKTHGTIICVPGDEDDFEIISPHCGTVLMLRWQPVSKLLLAVSGSDVGGNVRLWKRDGPGSYVHSNSLSLPHTILDAVWLSESRFVICGHDFLALYSYNDDTGLRLERKWPTNISWEKIRFDGVCNILACASLQENQLGVTTLDDGFITTKTLEQDYITDLDFQPIPNPSTLTETSPRLLATSTTSGVVHVWDAKNPFNLLHRLSMPGAALAMAFSPDGFLVAAASKTSVHIWHSDGGQKRAWWRKEEEGGREVNGRADTVMSEDGSGRVDPVVGWDADGKRLVWGLGSQVSIINLQQ